jgi:hypothetical protein
MRKLIALTLAGLVLLYVVLCGGLFAAMRQPPERFGVIMKHVPETVAFVVLPFRRFWMVARAGNLNIGDAAPDFSLPSTDHSHVVNLASEYRTKPVVLIFGSYT